MINPHASRKLVGTVALVLCSALLPRFAHAAPAPTTPDVGAFAAGPTIGFQTGNGVTQFRLTGEAQYGLLTLAPQWELDLAGHFGVLFGDNLTTIEIVPEARFRYFLDNKLSLYGDGGFGIAFASVSVGPVSASQTWGVLRFAGGVQYKITPQVILMGEPVGLNIYFGTGSGFQYGLAAGVLYRF